MGEVIIACYLIHFRRMGSRLFITVSVLMLLFVTCKKRHASCTQSFLILIDIQLLILQMLQMDAISRFPKSLFAEISLGIYCCEHTARALFYTDPRGRWQSFYVLLHLLHLEFNACSLYINCA